MMLIYSHKKTNRVIYTCNLLFKDLSKCEFTITTDKEEFKNFSGPKLCYSYRNQCDQSIFLKSTDLLFDTGIKDLEIRVQNMNDSVRLFETDSNCGFGFDIFACCFFMASRYEEYLPHMRDQFDRFDAQMSLASREGFLDKAVVNRWAIELFDKLKEKFPDLKIKRTKFEMITTIDIDNAWAYLEKGLMRSIGGFSKSLATFNLKELSTRFKVLMGLQKDPYDTYEFQQEMYEKFKLKLVYFFLLGDYGVNDKNIPYHSRKFQSLIKSLSDIGIAGIHPSFGSNTHPKRLEKEVRRLKNIINREVKHSRQHFLKLKLPDTYRNLIETGITHDYTMGYASMPGFRAGICVPYHFYDLDMEMETHLKVHPFMVMEGTIKYYMEQPPELAMNIIQPLLNECKLVGGTFISLWHNDSLNDVGIWKGWRDVFINLQEEGLKK